MIPPEFLSIDLGALRTLRLVHRLNSFSGAADELDIKQSSVSYTIDRLRKALNDPLFVRQNGRVAPTARCLEAVEAAGHILSEAERLAASSEFDPSTATGTVKISGGFLVRAALMGAVLRRLRREAPGLRLHLSAQTNAERALFEENVDIAISPMPFEASGVFREPVYSDEEVTVMDPANPLAKGELTLERFLDAQHIVFDLGHGFRQFWLQKLDTLGLEAKVAVKTPDAMDFPNLIRGTDLIATVAKKIVVESRWELAFKPSPVEVNVEASMHWTASAHRSPLNVWLRSVIKDCAQARWSNTGV